MKPSTFVLAESFDATSSYSISPMPDSLYDTVEAFTAPVLEPEYLDFDTCLHCDDLRIFEAINQFNQDTFAPCPCCNGRDKAIPPTKPQPRFNMPAIYLTIYNRLEREGKLTIWERKHRDSLLKAA
ncbi:MAG: hypothetical protein KC422_24090 [Trueperaceae bacterium]|nr:hypothetical protein [Trueperaceae bacterium]